MAALLLHVLLWQAAGCATCAYAVVEAVCYALAICVATQTLQSTLAENRGTSFRNCEGGIDKDLHNEFPGVRKTYDESVSRALKCCSCHESLSGSIMKGDVIKVVASPSTVIRRRPRDLAQRWIWAPVYREVGSVSHIF